jgi:hypothetical protein
MRFSIRSWLARILVAAIALGGGLNGYAAYATHGDHDTVTHVLGMESGKHDHKYARTSGSRTYVLFCEGEASCHEERGNTTNHVHVSCCGPLAVTAGGFTLAALPASAVIDLDSGPQSLLGQVVYPLFKPPRPAV